MSAAACIGGVAYLDCSGLKWPMGQYEFEVHLFYMCMCMGIPYSLKQTRSLQEHGEDLREFA